MDNTYNGRYYTKDDINHRMSMIIILENECRLANEYLNKEIPQKDVDYIGIKNFADALTLISTNTAIINQYKEVVKHFTTLSPAHYLKP